MLPLITKRHLLFVMQECRLNRSSNSDLFQTRIEKALSDNQCLSRDKFSKKPNFIISHYAGKVCYQLAAMVEKNKVGVFRNSYSKKQTKSRFRLKHH